MESSNKFILEFQSKYCKKKEHNNCSNRWKGLGFVVTCTCNCHKEGDKKNIALDGPSKSSNTHHRNHLLNLSLETD